MTMKIEKLVDVLLKQGYIDEDEKGAILDCFWLGVGALPDDLIPENLDNEIQKLASEV